MKKISQTLFLAITLVLFSFAVSAQDFPWKKSEVIQPSELAQKIKKENKNNYVIFNIGPVEDILYAKNIGAVTVPDHMKTLENELKKINKNKEIIFYCGCCAMENCPNIEPTYTLLKKMGFKKVKVLNIEESLYMDWISKKYPMSKK